MTDKELLERLRAEVAAVTPDCWSGILARVQSPAQQPEEAPVVPMPERKRRSAWRGWVAAAAVFFLVILGGGLYATQVPGGVATLDANPSIELTVNGQIYLLGPGDAYYFDSRLPHRFRNTGKETCRLVSACTPPSF